MYIDSIAVVLKWGFPVFQSLKIQRSVGRARDGTTFPLSLKLKSNSSGKAVADSEATSEPGYHASVWVFCTISGLITLLPDGTIYGVNHSFALMLFGYGKTELLGKVGSPSFPAPGTLRKLFCMGYRAYRLSSSYLQPTISYSWSPHQWPLLNCPELFQRRK